VLSGVWCFFRTSFPAVFFIKTYGRFWKKMNWETFGIFFLMQIQLN
jgi:hypothetical protein